MPDTLSISLRTGSSISRLERLRAEESNASGIRRARVRTSQVSEDAVANELSRRELASQRGSQGVSRALSTATSLVDIGLSVTRGVRDLVNQAQTIQQEIADAPVGARSSELSEELASILAEIDSINGTAEFNGSRLVDQGANTYQVNLDARDRSNSNIISITVPNVATSRDSLGLSDIDSLVTSDPDAAETTLTNAELSLNSLEATLENSGAQVAATAVEFGQRAALINEASTRPPRTTPESLAQEITAGLETFLAEFNPELNQSRVLALLEEGGSPSSSATVEQSEAGDKEQLTLGARREVTDGDAESP